MIRSDFQFKQQRGATLIVVLLLLVLVTILGLAVMRDSIMQERMAGYTLARGYAFQAAEAALREAEDVARGKPSIPTGDQCVNGICPGAFHGAQPLYQSEAAFWTTARNYRTASASSHGIAPQYSIEDFGMRTVGDADQDTSLGGMNTGVTTISTMQVYRITVRSQAPGGTEVLLQTLFQTP